MSEFLPYKPGGCLKSCVSHPIPNAMIENGCSLVFPPWGRESNPSQAKHGMVIDARPVASAPYKALKCFCLYPLAADKFNSPRAKHGVVVDCQGRSETVLNWAE